MKRRTPNADDPPSGPPREVGVAAFSEFPRHRSMSHSLGPGPRSIRTLRPMSRTEQPPPGEVDPSPGPGPARRRAAKTAVLAGVVVVVCSALGVFALHRPPKHRPAPSTLVVNGAAALKKTASGEVERWSSNAEVSVAIDSSLDQLPPGARDAVFDAFGAWLGSGAAVPKLRFDTTTDTRASVQADGKNVVMFAPIDIAGHEHDLAITVGFSDGATGQLVEADIILNSDKKFGVVSGAEPGPPGEQDEASACGLYDVQSVVTHEAGHFFGLGEDMDNREATMFYKTGKCELGKRQLHPSDSSAMIGLYSKPLPAEDPGSPGGCAVHGGARAARGGPRLTTLVLLVAAAGLLARRRWG